MVNSKLGWKSQELLAAKGFLVVRLAILVAWLPWELIPPGFGWGSKVGCLFGFWALGGKVFPFVPQQFILGEFSWVNQGIGIGAWGPFALGGILFGAQGFWLFSSPFPGFNYRV